MKGACVKCGRKEPATVLDREAKIHHGCALECVDRRACRRAQRARRRKEVGS